MTERELIKLEDPSEPKGGYKKTTGKPERFRYWWVDEFIKEGRSPL